MNLLLHPGPMDPPFSSRHHAVKELALDRNRIYRMEERICVANESSPLGDSCSCPAVHPVHPVSIFARPACRSRLRPSDSRSGLLRPTPAYSGQWRSFFSRRAGECVRKRARSPNEKNFVSQPDGTVSMKRACKNTAFPQSCPSCATDPGYQRYQKVNSHCYL